MDVWLGIGATILVAVITPGPNNLLVLAVASDRGFRAALPAMAGVVAGTLILLLLVLLGAAPLLAAWPLVQQGAALAGGLFLLWLAFALIFRPGGDGASPQLPRAGLWPLLLFQLANPKSWTLVLAVSAMGQAREETTVPLLIALFVMIPAFSLSLWAVAGRVLSHAMTGPGRRFVDRALGAVLAVSVCYFLLETVGRH